ncbi:hypothetical protein ACFLR4_03585 [Bacteroidota bacterium]
MSEQKINIIRNEEGFALMSVLVVSALITGIVMILLVYVMFINVSTVRKINKRKLELACISALELNKLDTLMTSGEPYIVNIDDQDVRVERNQKGLYWEVTAEAVSSGITVKLKALIGSRPSRQFNNALSVSQPDAQLVAAGNTRIRGDIFSPKSRIAPGRIMGIESLPSDYHKGEILSGSGLNARITDDNLITNLFSPVNYDYDTTIAGREFILDPVSYELIKNKNRILVIGKLIVRGSVLTKDKKISLDFSVNNKVVFEEGAKTNFDFTIHSDSSIVFEKRANIGNIIVISDSEISVGENSTFFNAQLISSKTVSIKGSLFNYPSLLMLYVDTENEETSEAVLSINSSVINGSVILICDRAGLNVNKSKILIENSRIQGALYSENYSEITGSILGTVYTYKLLFNKAPTEYINWMVNLNIDRPGLDDSFLLPVCFNNVNDYEILRKSWIY